jgi:integrase
VITVRQAKFGKTRLLPLHPTAAGALRGYLRLRGRLHPRPQHGGGVHLPGRHPAALLQRARHLETAGRPRRA